MPSSFKVNSLWSLVTSYGNIVVQMFFSIAFARLIDPVHFGAIATMLAIITVQKFFIDAGFYQALIKTGSYNAREFNSVFTFTLTMGVFLSAVLWLFSSRISDFFGLGSLNWMIPVGGTVILLSESVQIMFRAKYMINLNFKIPALVEMSSNLVSSLTALLFFFISKDGLIALLLRECTKSIIVPIAFFYIRPLNLKIVRPFSSLKLLFSFGFRVFFVDQIESLALRISHLYISSVFGQVQLGLYTRADQYKNYFTSLPAISINKVLFATFSKNENLNKKDRYRIISQLLFMLVLFISVLIFISAEKLFVFMFGQNWNGSVIFLRILLSGSLFFPLVIVNLNALKVFEVVGLYFRVALISKVMLVPFVLLGATFFGVKGVAFGSSLYFFVNFLISAYFGGRLINFGFSKQINFVLPLILLSAVYVLWGINFNISIWLRMVLWPILYVWFMYLFRNYFFTEAYEYIVRLKSW